MHVRPGLMRALGSLFVAFCVSMALAQPAAGTSAATKAPAPLAAPAAPVAAPLAPTAPATYWPGQTWAKATPASIGMDPAALKRMVAYAEQHCPGIRSLVVVRRGRVALEEYMHGGRAGELQNLKSVTKSFMSALMGMALAQGLVSSLDTPLSRVFPGELAQVDDSAAKGRITLRNLMTMRSGLDIDENSPEMMDIFTERPDWPLAILRRPMARDTGGEFHYSTCDADLLSCAFTRLTGRSMLSYAKDMLFRPIGIGHYEWSSDPDGNSFGGSELFVTPMEMARFGYLYLRKGKWAGRQVVPAKWVAESTTDPFNDPGQYAYMWWVGQSQGYPMYYALGYGGQFIYVLPALDLVMVVTQTVTSDQSAYSVPSTLLDVFAVPATSEWRAAN